MKKKRSKKVKHEREKCLAYWICREYHLFDKIEINLWVPKIWNIKNFLYSRKNIKHSVKMDKVCQEINLLLEKDLDILSLYTLKSQEASEKILLNLDHYGTSQKE